jgi:hypothetical protein
MRIDTRIHKSTSNAREHVAAHHAGAYKTCLLHARAACGGAHLVHRHAKSCQAINGHEEVTLLDLRHVTRWAIRGDVLDAQQPCERVHACARQMA